MANNITGTNKTYGQIGATGSTTLLKGADVVYWSIASEDQNSFITDITAKLVGDWVDAGLGSQVVLIAGDTTKMYAWSTVTTTLQDITQAVTTGVELSQLTKKGYISYFSIGNKRLDQLGTIYEDTGSITIT